MLEKNLSINFFLKGSKKDSNSRYVYLRVTIDGICKETSISYKWDLTRWNQKSERAIGNKEDAKILNLHLDSIVSKIHQYKLVLMNTDKTLSIEPLMNFIKGNSEEKPRVLVEFQKHNDEMLKLVPREFAPATHKRYVTARSHVAEFIQRKYKRDDFELRELNYEFIVSYEHYLKTVRKCSNNTTIKYISNFHKIVLHAVSKDIIPTDPFKLYKPKKTKLIKLPLTNKELSILENKNFETERLSIVRDVFVFQCYTGLAYIDAFQLKKNNIYCDEHDNYWLKTQRQKTDANIIIPLLPKALEIVKKYENHPDCSKHNQVLPVRSNQKMNEYLKEISFLCNISELNTHKARRTFGSTVTLANGVPIHVVKEMLGHASVKQTEEYALTEQQAINSEMNILKQKLTDKEQKNSKNTKSNLDEFVNYIGKLDLDKEKLSILTEFINKLV
ncbi:site-specific integrase [Flavobacterium sp. HSC-61S13]|uniref:site-specific integrase n=1 Tax=Flavobacterium sp. HSC-61S13 TaxID=2910963 RepID=UPI00209FD946|nr:site-specific integrase [Flavobacterium sp. HSC-61S13]MCP1994493.1 site-specific recombinase XerD [Flavobacterium sp. HSC-61S13]